MWLVSLVGNNVFHNECHICVTSSLEHEHRIREFIKQTHGITFGTDVKSSHDFISYYRRYDNITDDRDVSLVLEKISTEEDIINLLN